MSMLCGMEMVVRLAHSLKALFPTNCKELGNAMEVRLVHSLKASSSILDNLSFRDTSLKS